MSKNRYKVAIFNDTNTQSTRHYGCSLVMYNLVLKLRAHKIDPVFFWPVGLDWRDFQRELKTQLSEIDAVIVNGEGSIHHSNESEKAVYLAEIAGFAAKELNIPAYLINSTLYENSPELYIKLNAFRRIFVRESSSLAELSTNGLHGNIVPDLTFSDSSTGQSRNGVHDQKRKTKSGHILSTTTDTERSTNRSKPDQQTPGDILITDSTFQDLKKNLEEISLDMNGTFISMKEPERDSLNSRLFKNASRFFGSFGLKPLKRLFYIPVQLEESFIARRKNRRPNISSFKRDQYKSIVDHEEFIKTICSSRLVITGRFHTVTLCIKTGTPFVAIESNTPKISALLQDVFGSADRLITMEELKKRKLQLADQSLPFSTGELQAIERFNREAGKHIDRMFKTIVTDISQFKQ